MIAYFFVIFNTYRKKLYFLYVEKNIITAVHIRYFCHDRNSIIGKSLQYCSAYAIILLLMGADGSLVCPPVFKTGKSGEEPLRWVRFPHVPATIIGVKPKNIGIKPKKRPF